MQPKIEKPDVVVEIASSDDDEDGPHVNPTSNKTTPQTQCVPLIQQLQKPQGVSSITCTPPLPVRDAFESRSFWKAGAFAVGPTTLLAPSAEGSLEHARVHPKFLHSNATSHKWAFGAIAELLDNAIDEVQNGATFVKVDKIDIMKDGSPALLFQDDGGGMNPECLRKCMSLGYSTKKGSSTIGQYGNGFKTSTMRLGADVIVFSRATDARKATQSVGLLSYTFLRKTQQNDVFVPMIDFDISSHVADPITYGSQDDWSSNLKTILEWSPFASKTELMEQFEEIGPHGTKVIIYNLWLNDEGIYELNFDDDDEDIRLRDEANHGHLKKLSKRALELQSHISYRIRYSLRAYASVLYLRKFENFKIILRGIPVVQFHITDELICKKVIPYRPQLGTSTKEVCVETTIGVFKDAPALTVCGLNVYHKNRLIRLYISCLLYLLGVLEANFMEPTHDKQDFERSALFVRMESRLKQMIIEYWKDNYHIIALQLPNSRAHNMLKRNPGQPPDRHAVDSQKQMLSDQQNVKFSSNVNEGMHLDQPIVGHQANMREGMINEHPAIQTSIGHTDGCNNEVMYEDRLMSMSVDQLCEENINLFMKCEEARQKEAELNKMIGELEKRVEQAKRRNVQMSLHLEARKKILEQAKKLP
ncbi:protein MICRORCHIDIA 2-like isoform X2 [Mangifera indica]|uniref:protein MICRORCHIDIA 2-like isoform X2 n=1 Tax=Mangifera indica TaxID=29780 RepID=UPI001CFAE8B4|nr:protein MICRORCHIDIA 2-like isoform X2 [Mangifera indica]